jgi:hypothetical protein
MARFVTEAVRPDQTVRIVLHEQGDDHGSVSRRSFNLELRPRCLRARWCRWCW